MISFARNITLYHIRRMKIDTLLFVYNSQGAATGTRRHEKTIIERIDLNLRRTIVDVLVPVRACGDVSGRAWVSAENWEGRRTCLLKIAPVRSSGESSRFSERGNRVGDDL